LARSWLARAFDAPQQRVSLDLRGVTSIDGAGKAFLARAYRHGNTLVGGATTKAIVDEIHATSDSDSRSTTLRVDGTLRRQSMVCCVQGWSRSSAMVCVECSSIYRAYPISTRRASAN
jgi:ABC-type transporter Mla MlaB component